MKTQTKIVPILFLIIFTLSGCFAQSKNQSAAIESAKKNLEIKQGSKSGVPPELFGKWQIVKMLEGSWVFNEDSLQPDIYLGKTYVIGSDYYEFPAFDSNRLIRVEKPRYSVARLSLDEFEYDTPKLSYKMAEEASSIIRINVFDERGNELNDSIVSEFWLIGNKHLIFSGGSPYYEVEKVSDR